MAIYTFVQKPIPTYPSQLSNYGNLSMDGAHQPLQAAAGFQTQDATATPVKSPQAFPTTVTTLNVPLNATRLIISPLTNSLNLSESDNTVTTNYVTLPVGIVSKIDCARMSVIYIKANTGAATGSSFYFEVI